MVLFHPHECRFQICLRIAVAVFPHDLKAFFILHQALSAFFQSLIKFLDLRLTHSLPENKLNPFSLCNPHQVLLQFPDFKRGTMIDLDYGIIRDLLMLCQFPLPVLLDDLPDFVHPLNHKHMCIPKVIFRAIPIVQQESVVLCIKGINRIQQACKMVIQAAPPDKGISVGICLQFRSIDIKFFQCKKPFFFQAAHELVIQFIQDFPCELFAFKIVKNIPLRLLPFRQPDKSKVSLAQINNPVNGPDSAHVCVGNDSIQHDWVKPGSSLVWITGQQA